MSSSSIEEAGSMDGQSSETVDDLPSAGASFPEWRSGELVDSGFPSTSPATLGFDGDDVGIGPSKLYGDYLMKIEQFTQIKERELRSDQFEAGGLRWYILVYPHGCDVSNHLSLFLCFADHDKLLPGWSHFAQFTISVINIDSKKSKFSDTLHRFWKKEHDWGWKKFMELSKVKDGFLVDGTLHIKAQVQVIREKADRPFRCLHPPYRRYLIRNYMTNVEQLFNRFAEEKTDMFGKLVDDKAKWPSFCAFWHGLEEAERVHMSKEKTDVVLKELVKHFFVEKDVTSTLVIDSLFIGLRAVEYLSMESKGRCLRSFKGQIASLVLIDVDTFVLEGGDIIGLLERAAMEPLLLPGFSSVVNGKEKNSREENSSELIERDERRLMVLGRRILEIFVLSHIFGGIEVKYQEAIALKRQEELIREEEAAFLAENELKVKRGVAGEKDKRSKKKQSKQKKSARRTKAKERDAKFELKEEIMLQEEEEGGEAENGVPDELLPELLPAEAAAIIKSDMFEEAAYGAAAAHNNSGDVTTELHDVDPWERSSSPRSMRRLSTAEKTAITPVDPRSPLSRNSRSHASVSTYRGKNPRIRGSSDRNANGVGGGINGGGTSGGSGTYDPHVSGRLSSRPDEAAARLASRERRQWLQKQFSELNLSEPEAVDRSKTKPLPPQLLPLAKPHSPLKPTSSKALLSQKPMAKSVPLLAVPAAAVPGPLKPNLPVRASPNCYDMPEFGLIRSHPSAVPSIEPSGLTFGSVKLGPLENGRTRAWPDLSFPQLRPVHEPTAVAEEFPHIDIINELLNEEHSGGGCFDHAARFNYPVAMNPVREDFSYFAGVEEDDGGEGDIDELYYCYDRGFPSLYSPFCDAERDCKPPLAVGGGSGRWGLHEAEGYPCNASDCADGFYRFANGRYY